MKRRFSISLQNRLSLTYALFISLALLVLILVINYFTQTMFDSLVKENIASRSREIVRAMEEQYRPGRRYFDIAAVEAMGVFFAQEGYIVTLEDEEGNKVWDGRSSDMSRYMDVMRIIGSRMEEHRRFDGTPIGRFPERRGTRPEETPGYIERFPVRQGNSPVGTVSIETYGPIFYSETESAFLTSLNRFLFMAGLVLIMLSIVISVLLSRAIAKPILKAGEAARRIAQSRKPAHFRQVRERPVIRVDESYHTRELAELSNSINSLAEEIEEGERRQKQLTSDVAHELRTPLSCLQGTLEAMIDGVYVADREHLESCHEEIMRLSRLVDDLNVLTGFEWNNAALNKTEFDLGALLDVTAEQWRAAAALKGISINTELMEAPVLADYDRMKQVFINLLSNAVKYTDQGGVTVTVKPREGEAGWLIKIADTGIGIPQADLPHIFERFYRSDKSRSRNTGGAGIGLSIAAAIIEAHGGSITAESNPSSGTVFLIELS
jgi:signal transduction histidine kinase